MTARYAGDIGLFDRAEAPLVLQLADRDPVRAHVRLMLEELARPGFGSKAVAEALMKLCLIGLLRSHMAGSEIPSTFVAGLHDSRLAQAVAAIVARPAADHSVASLAETAGMGRSAFCERFQSSLGRTPIEFVQAVRLRTAAHLLRTTDVPVKVIATSIGYASRSHFSRSFRARYDLDPAAFRKQGAVPAGRS